MTYCFGFIYKNSVYLYADSAVTGGEDKKNVPARTSFGEHRAEIGKDVVYEAAFKIHKIYEKCYLAFAGHIPRANEIIRLIKNFYKENQNLSKSISSVESIIEPGGHGVSLLIAEYSAPTPKLFHWDTDDRELKEVKTYCGIGGLKPEKQKYIENGCIQLTAANHLDQYTLLTAIGAIFQTYCSQKHTLREGVGGVVSGLFIDESGANWIKDTIYLICNDRGKIKHHVMSFQRGNGCISISSYTKFATHFVNEITVEDGKLAFEKWDAEVVEQYHRKEACNWVFINTETNTISIIHSDFPTSKTTVSSVKIEDKHFTFVMEGPLVAVVANKYFKNLIHISESSVAMDYYSSEAMNLATQEVLQEHMRARLNENSSN